MSNVSIDDEEFESQGLSDTDMSAIDGIWTTIHGEEVEDGPVLNLEIPARPTGEGVGLETAKEAFDEVSASDVFPWRSASRELIAGQWKELREFVEWAVRTYRFENSEHLGCWWRHNEIVLEWVALRHLYDLDWNADNSGDGPNNFHYWFEAGRRRLTGYWKKTGCSQGEHETPRPIQTQPTRIDEAEWAELTGSTTPYEQPEQWPFRAPHGPAGQGDAVGDDELSADGTK